MSVRLQGSTDLGCLGRYFKGRREIWEMLQRDHATIGADHRYTMRHHKRKTLPTSTSTTTTTTTGSSTQPDGEKNCLDQVSGIVT